VIYSSTDPKDLTELRSAMTIETPRGWFRCACMPSTGIRLFHQGQELAWIDVFEGVTVRTPLWSSDARIEDLERWLKWFDARNIAMPRQEAERERATLKQFEEAEARWMNAMPDGLRPLWPKLKADMVTGPPLPDVKTLDIALAQEFPDTHQRIRRLLYWYGSGEGPWSGFPMYEGVAEEMLLEYSTPELLAAIQDQRLGNSEIEGAARLLGGWEFNRRRPDDNSLIPTELKKRLLEHSLKSSDEDKVGRARKHFEQKGTN
jgi:hypothetical protein